MNVLEMDVSKKRLRVEQPDGERLSDIESKSENECKDEKKKKGSNITTKYEIEVHNITLNDGDGRCGEQHSIGSGKKRFVDLTESKIKKERMGGKTN